MKDKTKFKICLGILLFSIITVIFLFSSKKVEAQELQENTNYAPSETYEVPSKIEGSIGEFYPPNEIKIESQDYIDSYFNFNFQESNNTHWLAEFTINENFFNRLKDYKKQVDKMSKDKFLNDFCEEYLSDYLDCKDKDKKDKLEKDINSLADYPLKSLTDSIKFSDFSIDTTNGKGSFYIVFPEGFKEGEKASFGFGTTNISTGTTSPWYENTRTICRDGLGNLHIVWLYNSTTIKYANSSDGGTTWSVNDSFINGTAGDTRQYPHISCDGNNITVFYEDSTLDDLMVAISTDNGLTWSWTAPVTSAVGVDVVGERRGQNIYIVYRNATSDPLALKFISSTDGGSTWGSIVVIIPRYSEFPSIAVDGTGTSTDKIYLVYQNTTGSGTTIWWINSTDSGSTWSGARVTLAQNFLCPSITFNSSNIYVASDVGSMLYVADSANRGSSFSAQVNLYDTSGYENNATITINEIGRQSVIFQSSQYNSNYDLVYGKYNGTSWQTSVYITNDSVGSKYPNSKTFFNNNRIEFLFLRGTASPYQLTYDYIGFDGSPNILGIPHIIPKTIYKPNASINCSAIYNGANNGRVEFIWYVNGILQNYNGSTANTVTNLTKVYTNVTLSNTTFNKYDNITCSARAYNGTDYSSWVNSSTITVNNSIPLIVNNQSYVNMTNQFNITATVLDPDALTDISSCRAFYKLDEPYTINDLDTFLSSINKTGTYDSTTGNCTVTIATSDSGQLRYGKDISSASQTNYNSLIVDNNYIYASESTSPYYAYRLNITDLTVYNSSNLGYAEAKYGLCQNANWLFVTEQGEFFKINKTDFNNTTISTVSTSINYHCQADDNFIFIGDNNYNLSKWRLSDNTLNLSTDFGSGYLEELILNSTSNFIYGVESYWLGVVRKINASNFSDVPWAKSDLVYTVCESPVSGLDYIWGGGSFERLSVYFDANGTTKRTYNYATPGNYIYKLVADDTYVYFTTANILRKLNKTKVVIDNNFTPEWTINLSETPVGMDILGNYLYILTTGMKIWKIDKNSSQVISANDKVVTKISFCDSSNSCINTSGSSNIMRGPDTIPPTITISSPSNTTYVYNGIWFNATLDKAGSWCGRSLDNGANASMTNSTGNWNNYTSGTAKGSHNVTICCNNTDGYMNCSTTQWFTIDNTPPTYSSNSTNSTYAGTPVLHSLNWTDNVGLSGYIFSFDNCTGSLTNDTWTSMTGATNWSNVTKTVNSTSCAIRWCVYTNDTSNNWNGTSCDDPFAYTTNAIFISISISPALMNGIMFGTINPSTNDNDALNNTNGPGGGTAYNITIDPSTTVNVDLYNDADGNLVSGSHIIGIGNVTHQANTTSNTGDNLVAAGSIALSTTYSIIGSICENLLANSNCWISYWLDSPTAQPPGNYNTIYKYCAVQNGAGYSQCG